jgi:hypothetical protein
MLPIPPHFDVESVGKVWRVPYQQRAAEAEMFFRQEDNGCYSRDVLARDDERVPGASLLRPVMARGKHLRLELKR